VNQDDRAAVPTDAWRRLWAATRPPDPHPVALEGLGEYAVLMKRNGEPAAAREFPAIAAHLATGCAPCAAELAEIGAAWELDQSFPPSAGRGEMAALVGGSVDLPRPQEPLTGAESKTLHFEDRPTPDPVDARARARRDFVVLALTAATIVVAVWFTLFFALGALGPKIGPMFSSISASLR
jgi:hypothetical protein